MEDNNFEVKFRLIKNVSSILFNSYSVTKRTTNKC